MITLKTLNAPKSLQIIYPFYGPSLIPSIHVCLKSHPVSALNIKAHASLTSKKML